VAPAGQDWLGRFERCRAAAKGAMFATEGEYWGDDELFAYAGRLAMGLAALRSQYIDSEAIQIAVWDGLPARGRGGTAVDIEMWRATNRKTIDVPVERIAPNPAPPQASALPPHGYDRQIRALMFGDTVGFSRLPERLVPKYREIYLGGIA